MNRWIDIAKSPFIGGQLPISLGPAFAARYRGTDQVSVAFFGDGGAGQGAVHEAMNLAATAEGQICETDETIGQ